MYYFYLPDPHLLCHAMPLSNGNGAGAGSSLAAFVLGAAAASACAALAFGVGDRRHDRRRVSSPLPGDLALCAESISGPGSGACIYLDHAATTPIYPEVLEEMLPYFSEHFGNPSSSHAYGDEPKRALALARTRLMGLLNCNSDEGDSDGGDSIIFTGCGTEADNLAIHLALHSTPRPKKGRRKHIVTCAIEHPAVLECLRLLHNRSDIDLTILPVDRVGAVALADVEKAIIPGRTALVTIMAANNEVGTLQPVKSISELCRSKGVLFHTDAAQAVGKVSTALDDLGHPDLITMVGHKMGAPKGVAALYVRPGCLEADGRSTPAKDGYGSVGLALVGGGQESGRRAGTENIPYIAGMGKAALGLTERRRSDDDGGAPRPQWRRNAAKMEALRARLLERLQDGLGEENVVPNGPADQAHRLPNTLSVGIRGVQSGELLRHVQTRVAASAGSACHSSGGGISQVLQELGVPDEFARGTLRLSVGPHSSSDEIDRASDIIIAEAKKQLGRK